MGRIVKSSARNSSSAPLSAEAQAAAESLLTAQVVLNRLSVLARQSVVRLAAAMAERLVGRAVEQSPEVLRQLYQEAVKTAGISDRGGTLEVHPADRMISPVESLAEAAGLTVKDDETVGRGGVRVCCGAAVLDASLPSLIERLADVLSEVERATESP